MDPYLSAVYYFAGNFAPRGFASCSGQTMTISQNTALFSLLGTYYGGNGVSTFQLPDLRGRVAVMQGNGSGLSQYSIGEITGSETTTMSLNQMPSHRHLVNANSSPGNSDTPVGNILGKGPATGSGPSASNEKFYNAATPNVVMNPLAIGPTGGGQAFSILQPVLAISCIIATQGIYPARN